MEQKNGDSASWGFWNTFQSRIREGIEDPWKLRSLLRDGAGVLEPMVRSEFEGTRKVVSILSDLWHVVFKTVEHPREEFPAMILGQEMVIGAGSEWCMPTVEDYLMASMQAMVARDRRNLTFLPKVWKAHGGVDGPKVFEGLANLHMHLYANPKGLWNALEDAMIATNPGENPGIDKVFLDLTLAQLQVYRLTLEDNAVGIEGELQKVLELTAQYWATHGKSWERSYRPEVLPVLSAVVYAHGSLGMRFSYGHPMLPAELVG